MSASYDNVAIFRQGIANFKNKTRLITYVNSLALAEAVVRSFPDYKPFPSFTGNTVFSFSIGIYLDGKLVNIINYGDLIGIKPLRKKIQKGDLLFLKHPIEYIPRGVRGKVKTESEYGGDTSKKWLVTRKDAPREGLCIKAIVGTEYYAYIDPEFFTMNASFITFKKLLNSFVLDKLKETK